MKSKLPRKYQKTSSHLQLALFTRNSVEKTQNIIWKYHKFHLMSLAHCHNTLWITLKSLIFSSYMASLSMQCNANKTQPVKVWEFGENCNF